MPGVGFRLFVLVGVAASLYAPGALAQSDADRAAARAAATEGVRALEQGRYKDALDLCVRAEAIMHAPTHVLLIARAQAKLGHLVEAEEAYLKIEHERLAADAPPAFVQAQRAAADEETALAPRIPTLTVKLEGGGPPDATVMLDGAPLLAAVIGLARPIDPGAHTLVAKGSTVESKPVALTVAEGSAQTVTLSLEPLASAGAIRPGDAEGAGTAGASPPHDEVPGDNAAMRIGGWVGLGVGAIGLVAGTVFVLQNRSNRNDANALCTTAGCPESKRADIASLDDKANAAATLAWVSYGVGAAGLATGAVLLWLGWNRATPPTAARLLPWVDPRSAGIKVAF